MRRQGKKKQRQTQVQLTTAGHSGDREFQLGTSGQRQKPLVPWPDGISRQLAADEHPLKVRFSHPHSVY